MRNPEHVRTQYADSGNLDARAALHGRFSTNPHTWFAWVVDRLLAGPHRLILDVGGGPGGIWSERGRLPTSSRVIATDLSVGMVTEARERIGDDRFTFAASDAQAIPFADGSFDVVVANHMLYHVPDLPTALGEIRRVLRAGGRLLAATNGEVHMVQLRRLVSHEEFIVPGFSLETGATQLEAFFDDVTCERFPDSLEVTEAEPILAYIRSMMANFWVGVKPEEELRKEIGAVIEREGVFRIDKDAGLFTAVRR